MTATAAGPARDQDVARRALARYDLPERPDMRLVRHGENTIFRVDAGEQSFALRVHRPGYQTVESLRSEFAWTQSLCTTGLRTAPAVPARDGSIVQVIRHEGVERLASMVRWMAGVPLATVDRLHLWHRLGELTATVHRHGLRWQRPDWFVRRVWDVDALAGSRAVWGDPLALGSWSSQQAEMLAACQREVRRRLAAAPRDAAHFGLIHADLSFENVLVDEEAGHTVLIDFDDGGFGWLVYDLAVSLFPYEDLPGFANRRDALVAGYRSVAALDDEDVAELPTFLMARRLATLGWIFTRAETDHAREQRPVRLDGFADAANRFLGWAAYRGAPRPARG